MAPRWVAKSVVGELAMSIKTLITWSWEDKVVATAGSLESMDMASTARARVLASLEPAAARSGAVQSDMTMEAVISLGAASMNQSAGYRLASRSTGW
jgi:hypothetical protein